LGIPLRFLLLTHGLDGRQGFQVGGLEDVLSVRVVAESSMQKRQELRLLLDQDGHAIRRIGLIYLMQLTGLHRPSLLNP
jgi:hypothetical protein